MPKVSIIMSAYNAQEHLAQSIQSILDQTFTDFEFLIMNDGSTDRTQEILEQFSDPRMHLFTQENKGLTTSLNTLIGKAKGNYIARMDADDISAPQRLEKQVSFLDAHPDIVLLGTQCDAFRVPTKHKEIKQAMLFHNPFVHPSIMVRREILQNNPYNQSFTYAQDYELWTRIVPFHQTANLPDVLLTYRLSRKGITAKKSRTLPYIYYLLRVRLLFILRLLKSIFAKPRGNK